MNGVETAALSNSVVTSNSAASTYVTTCGRVNGFGQNAVLVVFPEIVTLMFARILAVLTDRTISLFFLSYLSQHTRRSCHGLLLCRWHTVEVEIRE